MCLNVAAPGSCLLTAIRLEAQWHALIEYSHKGGVLDYSRQTPQATAILTNDSQPDSSRHTDLSVPITGTSYRQRDGREYLMRELTQTIPDADALLTMEPEVLGAKMLFLLRKRASHTGEKFHAGNLNQELWHNSNLAGVAHPYSQSRRDQVDLAIAEAWQWLIAQGFLVPIANSGDWVVLSRRALKFQDEQAVAIFSVARMLRKEVLQAPIANTVWGALMRGEFDAAVFQAMKAVEVAVHEALGKPGNLRGVDLMRKAFHAQDGKLTDLTTEVGERQSRSDLFAGAIGSFKNPHSHRNVTISDPTEAIEAVMLANHLLRIVASRVEASNRP